MKSQETKTEVIPLTWMGLSVVLQWHASVDNTLFSSAKIPYLWDSLFDNVTFNFTISAKSDFLRTHKQISWLSVFVVTFANHGETLWKSLLNKHLWIFWDMANWNFSLCESCICKIFPSSFIKHCLALDKG